MDFGDVREVGEEAVWTLSTAKPGNGVDQLRDGTVESFWQSDGVQPHLVNIQFQKKMRIKEIQIYVDEKLDESYTPQRISIRCGTTFHDLHEVQLLELQNPSGWVSIPLADQSGSGFLRTHLIQIAVLASFQSGRDTHIRQIKVYAACQPPTKGFGTPLSTFTTIEFEQFTRLR
ncbi:Anaphase-promoting complex subunit 10 [Plasmodiophora brassicae]|uniref:Anaphase-promoting complex subunit 10 n=1 Tax=Plasmodiophora brassicae TaxID=37360 RepID=A0A0G4J263_PLABS|nr:hypothetical protein PBRA_002065 [Plasmodiophora brassicae]SPQ93258.1 unnamed protein product [Plasmodiophora brassicae]